MTTELERAKFTVIVVPLDLEADHDRAVTAAAGLAALGNLPIVLLTVSSPGLPDVPDRIDLRRTADQHHLDRWSSVVLHDNDPAHVLSEHLSTLTAPLVVMASGVRGMISELSSADVTGDLLAEISGPALVLGPHVPVTWHPRPAQLMCCMPPGASPTTLTPWTDQWLRTFGGSPPVFVTVEPLADRPIDAHRTESARATRHTVEADSSTGPVVDWRFVHDDDVVNGLMSFTADTAEGVLVVTSTRWSDTSRLHRHSVARHLAQRSAIPVLVLPRAGGGTS